MRVTVVGAGVSGLTSAVALQEAGHEVRVVARQRHRDDVGPAGAVWYPFRADPSDRVIRWATRSREYLAGLAATTPEAGVDLVEFYELIDDLTAPWWAASAGGLRLVLASDPTPFPLPSRAAWVFESPCVTPAIHLEWLEAQLHRPVELSTVESLGAVEGDVVVNCTGLGARWLCNDGELAAIFGQTVIVEPGVIEKGLVVSDERDPADIFYAIPRRTEVLLGGSADECADDRSLEPDPGLRDAILARARSRGFGPTAPRCASSGKGESSTTTAMAAPATHSHAAARRMSFRS
jgi:D-amino-acid oxidase